MLSRTEFLLGSVPKHSRIIEIGPSFNPIAPRSQGWNSSSIDHMTREDLSVKYSAHPGVDVSKIEPVDFVWTTGTLSDAVPIVQHGSFDVFLASHVIEHTPDLIAFLNSAETLLKKEGVIILAIPDKRYCFDYFQQITTTGQVLDAHVKKRRRHTGALAFDHIAYAVTDGGEEAWGQRPSKSLRLIHDLESALQNYRLFEDSASYHDMHAWHFVPPSFELLLLELARLGETDWQIDRISPVLDWEFSVWLSRGAREKVGSMSGEDVLSKRTILLKRILLEALAQINWLLAAEPELAEFGLLPSRAMFKSGEMIVADLAALQSKNLELHARLETSERRVAAVEASTSWRATASFRILMAQIRRTLAAFSRSPT